jgi:hypothetical protein
MYILFFRSLDSIDKRKASYTLSILERQGWKDGLARFGNDGTFDQHTVLVATSTAFA